MQKAMFVRLKNALKKRWAHISKTKRFKKLMDNPAGNKMSARSSKLSARGCDGTMR